MKLFYGSKGEISFLPFWVRLGVILCFLLQGHWCLLVSSLCSFLRQQKHTCLSCRVFCQVSELGEISEKQRPLEVA